MVAVSFSIEDPAQAEGTLCAGLIVGITSAAIPIYDVNPWSLGKRALALFLVMLVAVLPLLLWSGWFTVPVAIGVFVLSGVVGWTAGYLVNRVQKKKQERLG